MIKDTLTAYFTLSRNRIQMRYRELRNQQSEHEHMQRSI